ncbi:bifunctional folylpolyglutamate synthase/dihydrofolate synthase [Pseudolabrys taiwanensis]|uniref:Dihydrofolate synthase/folylpolyglutamate synthase n=1 Tax=Pseudolabrys taiwanensis TaxID=331696 RepID=A0A345ZZL0_9HYPH|nr:folylpolyglutamate synthase/dihydrofolate synthase family protein [Pseudolabrys taiwanensis]AXK82357.1 bifunctional folylpolyglutamate synthase/dihydrofolate synthase [Pseudolabrys taiwanensis]
MTPIDSILARLTALHPKRIDLSLDRLQQLLAALGHPEKKLPPVIHVAGTNGKGSTVAFLRAILEAAGKRVHVYTSPHLARFNERFRLNGALVSNDELAGAMEECERANKDAPITVFEITTAAGLLLFSRHPADVLLLEVGLGGRLDATNVIDAPLATVITRISMDHVDFLGDTLEKIAAEKAGILKRNVPAIIAAQHGDVLRVIERQAARLKAPLKISGEDFTATEERGRLVYQDDNGLLDLPAPKLYGRHQFENAGLAIATLRAIPSLKIPAAAYEAGLVKADWPARMQRLAQGKLVDLAPPGSELWLDGGHNPDGGRAIAAALADLEERVSRPLVLIVGMLATKDCEGFLRNFTGLARRMIAVPIPGADKPLTAEAVADCARNIGLPATSRDNLSEALDAVRKLDLEPPPRILITGSLYLAGDVLRENGTLPS